MPYTQPDPQRNADIKALRASGMTLRELSARYGLSYARIHIIANTSRPSDLGIAPPANFAQRLAEWRTHPDVSLTRDQAARYLSASYFNYFAWESGKRTPSHANLILNYITLSTAYNELNTQYEKLKNDPSNTGTQAALLSALVLHTPRDLLPPDLPVKIPMKKGQPRK